MLICVPERRNLDEKIRVELSIEDGNGSLDSLYDLFATFLLNSNRYGEIQYGVK